MSINVSRYDVIVSFRTLKDLQDQMKEDGLAENDLKNIFTETHSSLLERAISSRKWDIANYLLDLYVPLNVVTVDGYNEFHIIAPHIREIPAVEIANRLLDGGVDLKQIDKKHKNTAMFSLTLEVIRRRNDMNLAFLKRCFDKNEGLYEKNKVGYCAMDLLERAEIKL